MTDSASKNVFFGASLDEAIANGLMSLGLTKDQVVIEVIEEGAKGLFGIGSRSAVVRLTPKSEMEEEAAAALEDHFDYQPAAPASRASPQPVASVDTEEDEDEDEVLSVVRDTVMELLEKMHISANVRAERLPEDPHSSRSAVQVDITGDDLSILIGRRAETLDALQYITRLIVGKELNSSVIVNIDVQGYRKRKEQRLRRIARSMAKQAVETGRRQYLEPMPAYERRIVHMELRDHPDVYSESIGEGSRRKVTINPKK